MNIVCPYCRQYYEIGDEMIGMEVGCTTCNNNFTVQPAKICPQCQTYNPNNAGNCFSCNANLSKAIQPVPVGIAPQPVQVASMPPVVGQPVPNDSKNLSEKVMWGSSFFLKVNVFMYCVHCFCTGFVVAPLLPGFIVLITAIVVLFGFIFFAPEIVLELCICLFPPLLLILIFASCAYFLQPPWEEVDYNISGKSMFWWGVGVFAVTVAVAVACVVFFG